jgi:hypothetical protein
MTTETLNVYPIAANIIDWAHGENFIGRDGFTLWPNQVRLLLRATGEYCEKPACSDLNFLEHDIKVDTPLEDIFSKVSVTRFGVCTKCLSVNTPKPLCEAVGVVGQRSGTTTLNAIIMSYQIHRILANPNALDSLETKQVNGIYISCSKQQAIENELSTLARILESTSWFINYNKDNTPWLKLSNGVIEYEKIKIECFGSKDVMRNVRGKTCFAIIASEGTYLFASYMYRRGASLPANLMFDAMASDESKLADFVNAAFNALKTMSTIPSVVQPAFTMMSCNPSPFEYTPFHKMLSNVVNISPDSFVNMSTWDMNPTLSEAYFREDRGIENFTAMTPDRVANIKNRFYDEPRNERPKYTI